jgi:hypothetical protein
LLLVDHLRCKSNGNNWIGTELGLVRRWKNVVAVVPPKLPLEIAWVVHYVFGPFYSRYSKGDSRCRRCGLPCAQSPPPPAAARPPPGREECAAPSRSEGRQWLGGRINRCGRAERIELAWARSKTGARLTCALLLDVAPWTKLVRKKRATKRRINGTIATMRTFERAE